MPDVLQEIRLASSLTDLQVQLNLVLPSLFFCLRKKLQQPHARVVGRLAPSQNVFLEEVKINFMLFQKFPHLYLKTMMIVYQTYDKLQQNNNKFRFNLNFTDTFVPG